VGLKDHGPLSGHLTQVGIEFDVFHPPTSTAGCSPNATATPDSRAPSTHHNNSRHPQVIAKKLRASNYRIFA
jgi:hypothetical protein